MTRQGVPGVEVCIGQLGRLSMPLFWVLVFPWCLAYIVGLCLFVRTCGLLRLRRSMEAFLRRGRATKRLLADIGQVVKWGVAP